MTEPEGAGRRLVAKGLRWGLIAAFGGAIGYAVWSAWTFDSEGLGQAVYGALEHTGVESPVTAVLMAFRAYDTLLEIVVLLIAYLGLRSANLPLPLQEERPPPVLEILSQILVPFLTLFAAYLLYAGSHSAGGAFQAGAVLAAAGLLATLSGARLPARGAGKARAAIAMGPLLFAIVALGTLMAAGVPLAYPAALSRPLIVVVEAASMISIAATLLALWVGHPLLGDLPSRDAR